MRTVGMRAAPALGLVLLVVPGLLAACGVPAGSGAPAPQERAAPPAATTPAAASPTASPAAASVTALPRRPAFLSHVLTDVRDGTRFTLSDFTGKQVLVIGMAVW